MESQEGRIVFEKFENECSTGGQTFAFVNYTGPAAKRTSNASTRRSIRKHVMRDIGRSRRATSVSIVPEPLPTSQELVTPRQHPGQDLLLYRDSTPHCGFQGCHNPGPYAAQPIIDVLNPGRPIMYCIEHQNSSASLVGAPRLRMEIEHMVNMRQINKFGSGRIDPFLPYPIKLSSRVRRFIDHIFGDMRRNARWYREAIFPLGVSGEASFHQILSNMALYLRLSRSLEDTGYVIQDELKYAWNEEVAHQAKVYRLVNTMLATKNGVNEDAIGAVAALACYAHVAQDLRGLRIHFEALRKMIELRGGIETLNSNKLLRVSLYWIDVNVSCTEDSRPLWPVPTQWYSLRPPLPPDIEVPSGTKGILQRLQSDSQHSEDFDILQVLEAMARFSIHTANEELRTAAAIYEDAGFTGTFINIFLFHLLSARPLSDDIDSNATFREAVRLGLLLFLACLKRRFGLYPVTFKIHVEKLVAVLQKDKDDWKEQNSLKLWIISMGLLEATKEAHITQLQRELAMLLKCRVNTKWSPP